jgi:predicted RNase H-like HicB family nuclease
LTDQANHSHQPERAPVPFKATAHSYLKERKIHISTACVTGQAQGSILSGMNLNAVIERDLATGLLVGHVPGIPGAHTQGESIEEVRTNLAEVIELLQSEDAFEPESEFIATTALTVA